MRHITAIFFQGLITILPLAVTIFILFWLGMAAEGTLGVVIKWILPQDWYVPGMGVVAGIAVIFLVGLLVNIWGVPQFIHLGELLIGRIPLVKTVYGAVRDLLGFFSSPGRSHGVSRVVIVTLTDTNIRVVGLLTREHFDDLPEGVGDEQSVVVYVPYSYQIGGFTIIVPRHRVQSIDMPLEDAMRFIVTAGAIRRTDSARQSAMPTSGETTPDDVSAPDANR